MLTMMIIRNFSQNNMEAETIQSVTWEHYYRKPFRCYAEDYGMILTADGHLALYLEEQPLTEALTAALNGNAVEYHGKLLRTRYCDETQEICTDDGSMIADVRGWGMLKAAGVPLSVAIFIQDEFGEAVAKLINQITK